MSHLSCFHSDLDHVFFFFFFLMIRRPPRSTLFPTRRSSDLDEEVAGEQDLAGASVARGSCFLEGEYPMLNASYEKDPSMRSEERRVGKECRSRWSPYH